MAFVRCYTGTGRVAKLVEMATAVISEGQVTGSSGQIK